MLLHKKDYFPPLSHVFPAHPGLHSQIKSFSRFVHVAFVLYSCHIVTLTLGESVEPVSIFVDIISIGIFLDFVFFLFSYFI